MENPAGPTAADSDVPPVGVPPGLPVHERNLIAARNNLARSVEGAERWAVEHPRHPISLLMLRDDVSDQDRIQALLRIESISLPAPLRRLLDASRYFQTCEAESRNARESGEYRFTATGDGPDESVPLGLHLAYSNLLSEYQDWGGYRYQGRTRPKHKRDYPGPMIWSADDAAFRFAKALEGEFPGQVHFRLKVDKRVAPAWDPDRDQPHSVSVALTRRDLSSGKLNRKKFRKLRHELFVNVEWLEKSRWTRTEQAAQRCREIQLSLDQLERSLEASRCDFAAMMIVDDEGFLAFHDDLLEWPDQVIPLIVSPLSVHSEGLAEGSIQPFLKEIEDTHERNCPLCGEQNRPVS